ncbi:ABC transporter ATP-binding protein [Egicoccus sp. AB-alg6-2]|uniref:ABC transporter ATP-binding protein n=1 Tax=Egicoccus sp. AB-alg6-2 TaxID=3242692 RepID=UPI00359DF2EC
MPETVPTPLRSGDDGHAQPMIELHQLRKVFPGSDTPAVDDLTLDIPRGEIVVLVGPSGCGKTTTLKMINRIVEPTGGRVVLDGDDTTDVPAHDLRRDIGYVIQQIGLFPHKTIAQNIATVPRLLGWDADRIQQRTDELLRRMDLDPSLAARYPSELSGGQRQRVGVARALAADPPVLLMDEPYGAVDPLVRARLQDELLELQRELGKTIVFVTHDIDEAIKLGDRIAILNVGGVLEQYDTPHEILRAPANDFVRSFLGAELALKQLSLLTAGDADLVPGPTVPRTATPEQARHVALAEGTDWVGVLGGDDHLDGWLWVDDLDDARTVGEHPTRPFRVAIDRATSLRGALDAIVTSRNQVAVVTDRGRYLGMLFVEDIARRLAS